MVAGLFVNGCWDVSQWLLGCYSVGAGLSVKWLLGCLLMVARMLFNGCWAVSYKLLGC